MDCGVYTLCTAEAHVEAIALALAQSSETPASTLEISQAALAVLLSPFLAGRLTPVEISSKRSELLERAKALSKS